MKLGSKLYMKLWKIWNYGKILGGGEGVQINNIFYDNGSGTKWNSYLKNFIALRQLLKELKNGHLSR